MNPTYSCYYCTYKATTTHIVPHYLQCHKEELYNANKELCRIAYKKGSPLHFFLKGKVRVLGCLGCSKFYMSDEKQKKHFESCPNKQRHKDIVGTLLPIEMMTKEVSTQTEL